LQKHLTAKNKLIKLSSTQKKIAVSNHNSLTPVEAEVSEKVPNQLIQRFTFILFYFLKNQYKEYIKKKLKKKSIFGYLTSFLEHGLRSMPLNVVGRPLSHEMDIWRTTIKHLQPDSSDKTLIEGFLE
jgi:hypothetical protein